MAIEGQSDKLVSDVVVHMKQRCVTEFLHEKKMAPTDIHQCLLNIYGDQTVDVGTVRQRVVHFDSGNGDVKDEPHCRCPYRLLQEWYAGSHSLLAKMHSQWW